MEYLIGCLVTVVMVFAIGIVIGMVKLTWYMKLTKEIDVKVNDNEREASSTHDLIYRDMDDGYQKIEQQLYAAKDIIDTTITDLDKSLISRIDSRIDGLRNELLKNK